MKTTLFPLLIFLSGISSAYGESCGLTQSTVAERVKDCSSFPDSTRVVSFSDVKWQLVARFDETHPDTEVWLDTKTGLLWGDESVDPLFPSQIAVCETWKNEELGICDTFKINICSESTFTPNIGIKEKKFGVPTIAEYRLAREHGIQVLLPRFDNEYFATQHVDTFPTHLFRGDGYVKESRYEKHYFHCIGR